MSQSQTILPFSTLSDAEVAACLAHHHIGLTVEEARTIERILGRPPTLTEATIWGIQGSEHCSYKSSRRFLRQFVTTGTHVILGPKEDSGIVAITDGPVGKRWGIVMSHESHNHPSQIVPFEGAATGVGGCVRDVLCMGARVIGCMDNLRFGDLSTDDSRVIASEVVRGVAGYANPLGIPNLGGDTFFDASYNANCLVNVVALGLVREDEIIHSYVPAEAASEHYDIIIVGKATDRSGFGGASFASVLTEADDFEHNTGAVQEPNPFLERHLLASTYALFDSLIVRQCLDKVSFKDLGAGGIVCSSVEQIAPLRMGASLQLDAVHVALEGLSPEVIACAETQERFCWICHPTLTAMILEHYNTVWDLPNVAEGACARVVGCVNDSGTYELRHHNIVVCRAHSEDLTSGLRYVRKTTEPVKEFSEPILSVARDIVTVAGQSFSLSSVFLSLLSHPSYASSSPILRHYDKNIIGNTLIEPGEADATVLLPLQDIHRYVADSKRPVWEISDEDALVGVALASGGNGRYGRISPYWQGANAVAENVRNVAAVGATARALTDCLNYGNPEIPEQLWALEQGVRGIADAAVGIAVDGAPLPVISGNVSLYNATRHGAIDPTAIVCVLGTMTDGRKAITMQLKKSKSSLCLLGKRRDECGGSAYYHMLEILSSSARDSLLGKHVPRPDFSLVLREVSFMTQAIDSCLILSSHDISDGGLLLACFEMTLPHRGLGGSVGVSLHLDTFVDTLSVDKALFTETGGFLLEVDDVHLPSLLKLAEAFEVSLVKIGETTDVPCLAVQHQDKDFFTLSFDDMRKRFSQGLVDVFG